MKYFLDTEFHEYHKQESIYGIKIGEPVPTIDLISIGIVSEDGREYYAISNEFNLEDAWNSYQLSSDSTDKTLREYWLRKNVLGSIFREYYGHVFRNLSQYNFTPDFSLKTLKQIIRIVGKSKRQIAEETIKFCRPKSEACKKAGIDYVVEPIDNPIFYGYYCDYDWVVFAQLFGKMIDLPKGFPMYCIDLRQRYDELNVCSKLELKQLHGYPKQTNEHQALSDAKWNRDLYNFLY